MDQGAMRARAACEADLAAIARIYSEGIAERAATFEVAPRDVDDVRSWLDGTHPLVVVEDEGGVIAFARSGPTSSRACYARNAEFAVYVARHARSRGAGTCAMRELVSRARAAGLWKLVSGVFPENRAGLAMVARLGFRVVGTFEAHGQLEGGWRDVVVVERVVAPTVVFACVHNAGRSQMAAAWAERIVDTSRVRVVSAGTRPAEHVHPEVALAMREVGVDISARAPRHFDDALATQATMLVTMGCGEECPVAPGVAREDWPLEDPKDKPIDRVREIRDEIGAKVAGLAARMRWPRRGESAVPPG